MESHCWRGSAGTEVGRGFPVTPLHHRGEVPQAHRVLENLEGASTKSGGLPSPLGTQAISAP